MKALLIFVLGFNVVYAKCLPIDLSNKLGQVRNQKNSGACYAFAAADLLSFYSEVKISALDVLINHNEYFSLNERLHSDKLKKGGWAAYALKKSLELGTCSEEDLPSENESILMLDFINGLESAMNKNTFDPQVTCNSLRYLKNLSEVIIIDALYDKNVDDIVRNLAKKNCRKRLLFPSRYQVSQFLRQEGNFSFFEGIKRINDKLDNNEPVIINYNSKDLLVNSSIDSVHFSLIVGRRYNSIKESCEYLIRNSWGESENGYSTNIESKKGHQWVSLEFLNKNLYEVVSLVVK